MTTIVLVVAAFGLGLLFGEQGVVKTPSSGAGGFFDSGYINDIYTKIQQDYINPLPDNKTITKGLAKGLVDSLGDKYSNYLSPTEAEDYLEGNDSAFEGIGVQLDFNGSYTVVQTPLDGYPGQKAGVLAGDIVLEVNGEDVAGVRPEIVATKIRGEAGSKVKLRIYRESEARAIDFEIQRERIDLENMDFELLPSGVGVIDIIKFTEGTDAGFDPVKVFNNEWDKLVDEVVSAKPKAIVLDLRNNPGGYVDSVKYVAEEFLAAGKLIMQEEDKQGQREQFADNRQGRLENIPLVVLVNQGSASAAEILAAAIQDNQRGKVVGMPTVGKGVEQKVITLEDRSLLFLVYKRWLTPLGNQLSPDSAIKPNVEVDFKPGQSGDPQLEAALNELK